MRNFSTYMSRYLIKTVLCLVFVVAGARLTYAQSDTIRMMQYNLMYYTNTSGVSDCNSTTNNLGNKDVNIKKIFHYVKPTVFCVCELGSNNEYADRLLNNAINTDGIDYYKRGALTNYSGGYIANMIYYDSRKLSLYDSYTITTAYRDINGYKMYYNSTDLVNGDTVFITFWIAHLKAGSSDANESSRLTQTQRLMNKISQLGDPGYYVFSGDFNFTSHEEPGYQELVEYPNSLYRFYDPVNSPGYWHNNYQFANLHTQSTRTYSDGCFVTGGLDDRFDFILVSPYIYYGSGKVHIVPDSYHALGQDGNRFNGSIVSPSNNSVPADIATALYNQSDHLPVIMDMAIDATVGIKELTRNFYMNVVNPVGGSLKIELQNEESADYTFEVYSIDGRLLMRQEESLEHGIHNLDFGFNYGKGIYLLVVKNDKGGQIVRKIIK